MYKLSDEVIAQIAKLLQLAMITGTDVVDNLRTMSVEVEEDTGMLCLTDEYREVSDIQIQKLLSELESQQSEG